MENLKNPTANHQQRKKNSFSIENILSRPESNNNTVVHKPQRFSRQNPFQNNHVLFDENFRNFSENVAQVDYKKYENNNENESDSEIKVESDSATCHSENTESVMDNETHSEAASEDDANSCGNQCKD